MSVVVVATIHPLAEHRDAVIAAFHRAVEEVHAEPGCTMYALHEADDRLVMVEEWESQESLEAHFRGEALVRLDAANDGRLAAPTEVVFLTALPAGDPAKGLLRP